MSRGSRPLSGAPSYKTERQLINRGLTETGSKPRLQYRLGTIVNWTASTVGAVRRRIRSRSLCRSSPGRTRCSSKPRTMRGIPVRWLRSMSAMWWPPHLIWEISSPGMFHLSTLWTAWLYSPPTMLSKQLLPLEKPSPEIIPGFASLTLRIRPSPTFGPKPHCPVDWRISSRSSTFRRACFLQAAQVTGWICFSTRRARRML